MSTARRLGALTSLSTASISTFVVAPAIAPKTSAPNRPAPNLVAENGKWKVQCETRPAGKDAAQSDAQKPGRQHDAPSDLAAEHQHKGLSNQDGLAHDGLYSKGQDHATEGKACLPRGPPRAEFIRHELSFYRFREI